MYNDQQQQNILKKKAETFSIIEMHRNIFNKYKCTIFLNTCLLILHISDTYYLVVTEEGRARNCSSSTKKRIFYSTNSFNLF